MPTSSETQGIYKRLLSYTVHYKSYLVIAVIAMIVSALTEPAFALLMKPLLNGSFVEQDQSVTRLVAAGLLLVFVLRGISTFITSYFMANIGWSVIKELRQQLFNQYLSMPTSYYDRASGGELISKITYNTEQVANAVSNSLTQLVRDSLTVVGLLAVMIYLSWQMTLSFLIVAPFVTAIVAFITRRFRNLSRRIQGSMGDVSRVTEEMVHGHRIIKVFNGQDYEQSQFEAANERNKILNLKMVVTKSAGSPIIQAILGLVLVGIILFATSESMKTQIDVGTFMSFMTAMLMLMAPVKRLTEVNATIQRGIAAGESIFSILDQDTEKDTGTLSLDHCEGTLVFDRVGFTYDASDAPVLKNISFTAGKGDTIALVGMSGSGKSSLVNLLPRLYQHSEGAVLIDGMPIEDIKLRDLRAQIAYVGQDVTLFNDTIRNNIAYGKLGSSDDEDVIRAAKLANAWEFIDQLPKGLDTYVGEKGALLSGGQRQRIAIARALLKDAPILILDEATAALDSKSEKLIQNAVETLSRDRTTLVIAHRLKTIEGADTILVLDEGKIIEQGSHAELLATGGHYADLYAMQFSEKN